MAHLLGADRVTLALGTRTVLDGVSLGLDDGARTGVVGPNGAGKSTLLRVLAGVQLPDDGRVTRAGSTRVGLLDQRDELSAGTVLDAVHGSADAHEWASDPAIRAVHAGLLADVPLDADLAALSGGQRRRVDVALGIIGRPELLFLDEPTTGFDPEARHQFWDLVRRLKDEGTTILLTTHYLDEAAQLGDRAGVITGGRLIDIGAIDEIGGAEARVPLVRWRDAAGQSHEIRTDQPGRVVAELVAAAGSAGGAAGAAAGAEPAELEVIRPSLEDVYLGLVRDDRAETTAAAAAADSTAPTSTPLPTSDDSTEVLA